jgi:hypothetical protein
LVERAKLLSNKLRLKLLQMRMLVGVDSLKAKDTASVAKMMK